MLIRLFEFYYLVEVLSKCFFRRYKNFGVSATNAQFQSTGGKIRLLKSFFSINKWNVVGADKDERSQIYKSCWDQIFLWSSRRKIKRKNKRRIQINLFHFLRSRIQIDLTPWQGIDLVGLRTWKPSGTPWTEIWGARGLDDVNANSKRRVRRMRMTSLSLF